MDLTVPPSFFTLALPPILPDVWQHGPLGGGQGHAGVGTNRKPFLCGSEPQEVPPPASKPSGPVRHRLRLSLVEDER